MAQPRVLVGGSLLLSLVLAGGAAVALTSATGDPGSTTAAPSPAAVVPSATPSSSPAPAPTAAPTPVATPSPSAVATSAAPAASASPSAAASAAASPSATRSAAPVTRYAYPKPTRQYTSLYISKIEFQPSGSGTTADDNALTVRAVDGDGTIRLGQIAWGDGTLTQGAAAPGPCAPKPSPTTRPGPYQPHGDDRTFVKHHRYTTAGTYKISVTVSSGNADCRPNGPASETVTLDLTVTVEPA